VEVEGRNKMSISDKEVLVIMFESRDIQYEITAEGNMLVHDSGENTIFIMDAEDNLFAIEPQ